MGVLSRAGSIRVLLIEDDLVDELALLRDVVDHQRPYEVTVARSVAEARTALARQPFDIVIADYNLPDGTTFDLMDAFAGRVVIFVTGAGDEATAAQALHLGVDDYLIKDHPRNYLKLLPYRIDAALRHARSQRELEASEERFRSLVEWTPEALFVHRDGDIVFANPAALALFGATSIAQLQPLRDQLHPEVRDRGMACLEDHARQAPTEMKLRRLDGTVVHAELQCAPIIYDGEPAVHTSARDVTARHDAEAAAHESAALIEQTFAASPIGMTLVDAHGRLVRVNPVFCAMLGRTEQELLGGDVISEVTHPDDVAINVQQFGELLAGTRTFVEIEKRYLHKDGHTVWAQLNAAMVRDHTGAPSHTVAYVVDITDRRRVAEQRAVLEAQLRQSQKMEAVGQLAGGVAHDFNNLLTVITGMTDLALEDLPAENPLYQDLQDIAAAADRAATLTRQLLAFSRRQVIAPVAVDLRGLIAGMRSMLRRLIREDIVLEVVSPPQLGTTRVDPGQIEQVIMNLAVNARDAMATHGTLTIATEDVELDEAFAARHLDVTSGRHVLLTVRDTGEGIDASLLEHIFEPFFTTKDPSRNTGLGLATVYGIVKQSDGLVTVDSLPGQGTTFKIYLPTVTVAAENVDAPRGTSSLRGTETILIVEDEAPLLAIARRILERAGYYVLAANNGARALELLEQHDGIDLVMTDVVMPTLGGLELASKIDAAKLDIKVLFTSGYTTDADLKLGVRQSTVAFLAKPYSVADLTRKVREVLDS
ncbi:MAG: PAS domain S-box protein [Proteobacteria bacterium]|nr:PAS domain S-box protein [Pseudomonadota bacterium]